MLELFVHLNLLQVGDLPLLAHFNLGLSLFSFHKGIEVVLVSLIVDVDTLVDQNAEVVGGVLLDKDIPAIESVVDKERHGNAACYLHIENECLVGLHDGILSLTNIS